MAEARTIRDVQQEQHAEWTKKRAAKFAKANENKRPIFLPERSEDPVAQALAQGNEQAARRKLN